MKSLFYTIIILGGIFLGYDYFFAPADQKVVFKGRFAPQPTAGTDAVKPAEEPKASEAAPAPAAQSTPPPAKSAAVDSSKATPAPAAAAAPAGSAEPVPDADGFTPPKFEPMEALTKNWTFIPKSAFPRPVTIMVDTDFKVSVGSSKLSAGSTAIALALESGMLTLAPTETSPARGVIALDSTDLRSKLLEGYEKWKVWRTASLKKAWERKKALAGASGAVSLEGAADASGKPIQESDGSFKLLLASIHAGQVTDIQQDKVKHWGMPILQTIDGQPTWTVAVRYETMTIFGPFEAEAEARVRSGKVIGWYFTGSGEEVP